MDILSAATTQTPHPSGADTEGQARLTGRLDLWDWRRRVAGLYAEVRASEPEVAWKRWCAERDALFRDHTQSPIDRTQRSRFPGVAYFAYDPSFRFLVDLMPSDTGEAITMAAGSDGTVPLHPFARTRGLMDRLGQELTLYWIGGYGGGVFLPFRDATSKAETFPGGRYLLDTIKGADLGHSSSGQAILDFNFAYNPSCSYSDQWVCPLAPPENTIPLPVRAGERTSG